MTPKQDRLFYQVEFEQLLTSVIKPSRYINQEIHSCHKQPGPDLANFCLVYPDVYEVGFSHLGLKILYAILNEQSDAMADRAYCPWPDFGDLLRKNELPLFGLESRSPLKAFDVVGFTLQSELTYTNILYMLELSGIELKSGNRDDNEPVILAGGPNATNPEVLSPFIDAFLIGDGEEAILEIKSAILAEKQNGREALLRALASIPGLYLPGYHSGSRVKARKIADINAQPARSRQLVPWQMPTHYRYVSEIMRGCSRGCRFCHAGFFYRPVRELEPEILLDNLEENLRISGWQEAALSSLSSSDYSCIKPVLMELIRRFRDKGTSLSLPSLRLDSLDDQIIRLLNELRQSGLTIAPEAGSQRLRNIINKNISEQEILDTVRTAAENGWNLIKLYFMIGLPFETEDDIAELISLIDKIISIKKSRFRINVTISPFVPKNHTPFQWAGMCPDQVLLDRALKIKNAFSRYSFLKIKYHQIQSSRLECILGRGDARIGELLLSAYRHGAIYDGWAEFFDYDIWEKAFRETGIDPHPYLSGQDTGSTLPWDHIDLGLSRKFLLEEWEKARKGQTTEDCRDGNCTGCGVCSGNLKPVYAKSDIIPDITDRMKKLSTPGKSIPYRIFYSKKGALRFVGHLDLIRTVQTILRASGLPLVYSRGFNVHPKIQFGPPLPIGIEGENEYFDLYLTREFLPAEVAAPIKDRMPELLELKTVMRLPPTRKQKPVYEQEVILIEFDSSVWQERFGSGLKSFREQEKWPIKRLKKGKEKITDLKTVVGEMKLEKGELEIRKNISGASTYDILENVFGLNRERTAVIRIRRTELY